MRRILLSVLLCFVVLSACAGDDGHIRPAIDFRAALVQSGGCSFTGEISADDGECIQIFRLSCDADAGGALSFTILEPETLEGISATVTEGGERLDYDGLSVDLGLLADESLAPAAAPGVILQSWLEGYILWGGESEEYYEVTYEQELNQVLLKVVTTFKNKLPISAEVCYNNGRILQMKIEEFQFH